MIQDYFGQETIWKLLANHPYEENNANGIIITYMVTSPAQNKEIFDSILRRIPEDNLVNVEIEKWQNSKDFVVKRIIVKNVFGNISTVQFLNSWSAKNDQK